MTFAFLSAQFSQLVGASALATSLALSGPAYVAADAAKSTVTATLRRMDVPVTGRFDTVDAQIAFDPARPKRGHAKVTIDTRTFDLGDHDASTQAQGKDWLDTAEYPSATFVSSSIVPAGGDKYSMTGRLTLRGHTQDVVVPVSVSEAGRMRVFDGSLPVRRHRFGIGTDAPASDAAAVADDVVIRFHLVVPKHAGSSTDKSGK